MTRRRQLVLHIRKHKVRWLRKGPQTRTVDWTPSTWSYPIDLALQRLLKDDPPIRMPPDRLNTPTTAHKQQSEKSYITPYQKQKNMLYRWQPQPHLCLLDLVKEVPQNHSDYVWSKSGVGLGVVLSHIIPRISLSTAKILQSCPNLRITKHVS